MRELFALWVVALTEHRASVGVSSCTKPRGENRDHTLLRHTWIAMMVSSCTLYPYWFEGSTCSEDLDVLAGALYVGPWCVFDFVGSNRPSTS